MQHELAITVRFYRLSEALQPYFTALYQFDLDGPPGQLVEDQLHPEWATLRFANGAPPIGGVVPEPKKPSWPFVVSGPTSRSIHFGITSGCIWGLGVLPAGWARFVAGDARTFADRIVDGTAEPAFHQFAPILDIARRGGVAPEMTASRINAALMALVPQPVAQERQIRLLHEALRDPDVANVADLVDRVSLGTRSLERLCARYFGFPPKQLLRRQRFLRSLAQFMLTPGGRSWSEALDGQYYDQAQFVKDFKSFMHMTPSEYAERPHPILSRIMAQRMADAGAAPETDLPTILRYTPELELE